MFVADDDLARCRAQRAAALVLGRRPELAVADPIHGFPVVAVFDVGLDELAQLLRIVPEEGRGELGVRVVKRRVDHRSGIAVVQIGAGPEVDWVLPNGFIEVLDQHGVGPGLIGWVIHLPLPAADKGTDDGVLVGGLRVLPLLQLNYDGGALAIRAGAGDDEINTFGGLRDVELDRDSGVVRDLAIFQHLVHLQQRMLP